ncbi:protein canopy 4-like [Lytechinus pictus]|uniref:protein canopy 4-like n=1 Tax=Lytechinus pictus TaxID=7653 RepID=UPI0030BA2869
MAANGSPMAVFVCLFYIIFFVLHAVQVEVEAKVTDPHREPSKCEVCKFVANELQETMEDTGKTSDVLHLGHRIDQPKREIKYRHSELRLLETLDEVCPKILQYNIHAERQNSRRFSKGMSETMGTLHGLVDKGVKVELGIPYQMWDEPSAAVTKMKQYCDTMVEQFEESIENWFFKTNQEKRLSEYLCRERVLSKEDLECLDEEWTGAEKVDYNKEAEEEREEEEREEKLKKERKKKKRQEKAAREKAARKAKGVRKGEEEDELEDDDEAWERKRQMRKEQMRQKAREKKSREEIRREMEEEKLRRRKRKNDEL